MDKTYKIISANDYFGKLADFVILWETVSMSCTFAVGVQTDKRNELSIFHVIHYNGRDNYFILDTCFIDVYQKYGFSLEEKVKKEMKKVIIKVLTARVKAGILSLETIMKWARHERNKEY